MKTTLFMAISANGMIADQNGSEDFLSHANWESFTKMATEFGNFTVGRKTYEAVKSWGESYGFDDFDTLTRIVVSRGKDVQVNSGYLQVSSPHEAKDKIRESGYEKMLITGGATLNTAFMQSNLVDELILNVEPVLVGQGIPLFQSSDFVSKLKLVEQRLIIDDILQLRYEVIS